MFEYSIWQMPWNNKTVNFMLEMKHDVVDLSEYVLVYSFESDTELELEDLFEMFNINQPSDYHARSMTSSDLIMVRNLETDITKNYVVEMFGFSNVSLKNQMFIKK